MNYPSIPNAFMRSLDTKKLILGSWSDPTLEYLANSQWIFTEKVDGTNIQIRYDSGVFGDDVRLELAGRTPAAQIPKPLKGKMEAYLAAHKEAFRNQFNYEAVLYGEGYGPKIQSGGKYAKEQSFVLFDVRVGDWWLTRKAVEEIAKQLELAVVPIIGCGTLRDGISLVQQGLRSTWGDFEAEGIVAKPAVDLLHRNGTRVITKIKACDFR